MSRSDEWIIQPEGAPRPEEPACSEDGVDLTLIRRMLDRTPEERLAELQSWQEFVEGARQANPGWKLAES